MPTTARALDIRRTIRPTVGLTIRRTRHAVAATVRHVDRRRTKRSESVARTLDPAAHAVRRDVFIDAAQALIQTRGAERFSVQDILDATDASKGAFYHYFDSK